MDRPGPIDYRVSDGVCVLRLSAPPVNTIGIELLDALRAAMARAAADPAVRGIILFGREDHFSAGADVDLFRRITSAEEAVRTSRAYQEAFDEVERSAKPVVAAVAGKMMGSAVELPLACHYRVCAEGATLAMPEVRLGINPGAGGTQRLPRLIGLAPALRMLLTGETVGAKQALEMGLIDELCPAGELLDRARAILAAGPAPRRTGERT
ncbi:MAG TPA: enoyl-CoA hydratase/isomerase family protein, partial [Phycisphaerae bacterium]|nr:enoyl-CoA hydratase/isomerase family protein [Phycisphaerae bacterium]